MKSIAGGAVESHLCDREPVEDEAAAPQISFNCCPGLRLTEPAQDNTQAIIIELNLRANGLPGQLSQALQSLLDPLLNVRFAVIAFREDVSQPDHDQPAVAQSPMQMMLAKMAIKDLGPVHPDHQPEQHRYIVYSFV
jgi:hypothetical protein